MADLDALKAKYQSVLDLASEVGMGVTHCHIQDEKLYLGGNVPSQHAKDAIWDAVKAINPATDDVWPDINIGSTTYKVQAGDTLSAIAKRAYGNANEYHAIFNANTDKLDNPDRIQVGQELTLPAA